MQIHTKSFEERLPCNKHSDSVIIVIIIIAVIFFIKINYYLTCLYVQVLDRRSGMNKHSKIIGSMNECSFK